MTFNEWLDDLEENVIQGEYGYEPGEFTVFPELWRPAFEEGLTAKTAFDRALKAFDERRKAEEAERKAQWERIQAADRAALGLS